MSRIVVGWVFDEYRQQPASHKGENAFPFAPNFDIITTSSPGSSQRRRMEKGITKKPEPDHPGMDHERMPFRSNPYKLQLHLGALQQEGASVVNALQYHWSIRELPACLSPTMSKRHMTASPKALRRVYRNQP